MKKKNANKQVFLENLKEENKNNETSIILKESEEKLSQIQSERKKKLKIYLKNISEAEENAAELEKLTQKLETDKKYMPEILKKYGTFKNFAKKVTKELPENVFKISTEEASHYLIDDDDILKERQKRFKKLVEENKLDSESNIYTYIDKSIERLINDTEYLHENLRIPVEISNKNLETIYDNLQDDLNALKEYYNEKDQEKIEFLSESLRDSVQKSLIKSKKPNLKAALEIIINNYTGNNSYKIINRALTSNNPLELSKMRFYINLLGFNYKPESHLVGNCMKSKAKVYRIIFIKKELIDLYEHGQIVFFTNLTSTSKKSLEIFEKNSSDTHITMKFQFTLLDIDKQIKNGVYSGLAIKELSEFKDEDEVLLFPYQFFIIRKKKLANDNVYIKLTELENKELFNKIMSPKTEENFDKEVVVSKIQEENKIATEWLSKKKEKLRIDLNQNREKKKKSEIKFQTKIEKLENNFMEIYSKFEEYLRKEKRRNLVLSDSQLKILKEKFKLKIFDKNAFGEFIVERSTGIFKKIKYDTQDLMITKKSLENLSIVGPLDELPKKSINFLYIVLKKLLKTVGHDIMAVKALNMDFLDYYCHGLVFGNRPEKTLYKLVLKAEHKESQEEIIKLIENSLNRKKNKTDIQIVFSLQNIVCLKSNMNKQELMSLIQEQEVEILLCQTVDRSKKFVFHEDLFEMIENFEGNENFEDEKIEKIGDFINIFPTGWKRFVMTADLEKNDWNWLKICREWPVAYISIQNLILDDKIQGKNNENKQTQKKDPKITEKGFQCTNDLNELETLLEEIDVEGIYFKVAFECRVNPDFIQFNRKIASHIYILESADFHIIRPYSVLIKQVKIKRHKNEDK